MQRICFLLDYFSNQIVIAKYHMEIYFNWRHYSCLLFFFVIVPGVGGNQLLAKLHKPSSVHWYCFENTDDFFTLWLSPFNVITPGVSDCWVENMQLYYNKRTRTNENAPGVVISTGELMRPNSMEWIDPSVWTREYDFGAYFIYIVDSLLGNGYERMRTLFGAPYDFRRGPSKFS